VAEGHAAIRDAKASTEKSSEAAKETAHAKDFEKETKRLEGEHKLKE